MKLIKQKLLAFQGGNSDKVYEVDLCEVGADQYVVNFRYGRRGAALKEGSKTPLPVAQAKAEKVFDSLVQSKLKKGYYDTQAGIIAEKSHPQIDPAESVNLPLDPAATDDPTPQAKAIVARLAAHVQGDAAAVQVEKNSDGGFLSLFRKGKKKAPVSPKPWPLDRIIWRAGELRITQAEPYLLRLMSPSDHERNYCVIYALGHCGSAQAIAPLQRFYAAQGLPDRLRRLAWGALLLRLPLAERQALQAQTLAALPADLLAASSLEALNTALDAWLQAAKPEQFAVLTQLYQASVPLTEAVAVDSDTLSAQQITEAVAVGSDTLSAQQITEAVAVGSDTLSAQQITEAVAVDSDTLSAQQKLLRRCLLDSLRVLPLRPPFFKRLRHIFKLAEYLDDFEVFALLAYRFEKDKAMFRPNEWGEVRFYDAKGRVHYLDEEELQRTLASPKAKLAYGEKTRQYLRRRVWRRLRRLGDMAATQQYVALASQVLLMFSDADAHPPRTTRRWTYDENWQGHQQVSHWDAFAPYWQQFSI